MPNVPLRFPPGMVRPATVYDAKGRWYDGNLVRWVDGVLQPWGGWAEMTGAHNSDVGGAVRGLFAWRLPDGSQWLLIGTPTKIYYYQKNLVTPLVDATPVGFTTGSTNSSGANVWTTQTEAASWQFDIFNDTPVMCCTSDGNIMKIGPTILGAASVVSGAPTSCKAVVVTPEQFLVALAASGDRRLIAWASQGSMTDWTPSATNTAGDYTLTTDGKIMAGRRGRSETLIWTDLDLWAMRYVGGEFIYSITPVGQNCGVISRNGMCMIDGRAFWMGRKAFYEYDGFVRMIPCEVSDYVFGRLNESQRAKVACQPMPDFGEVIWYYPSGSGTPECDSYVVYNYVGNFWYIGYIDRCFGIGRGVLDYPISAHPSGGLYEHESGTTYADESGSLTPYIESGPIELGAGDNVFMARRYIPDANTTGGVTVTLYSKMYPTGSETTNGAYTASNPTDIRITAREVRCRFVQSATGWRLGTPSLEVVPGGLR